MTTTYFITLITTILLSTFGRWILDAYKPSDENIKLYIKKGGNILLAYLLPIGYLTNLFVNDQPINKLFLFQMVVVSMILLANAFIEVIIVLKRRTEKNLINATKEIVEQLAALQGQHLNLNIESAQLAGQMRSKTLELNSDLAKRITQLEKKVNQKRS